MATSTISNTTKDANGNIVPNVVVNIWLAANGSRTGGFRKSDDSEISSLYTLISSSSGVWAKALEQNSNIAPGGSYYVVEELYTRAQGGPKVWAIVVGSSNQTVYEALATQLPNYTPLTSVPDSILSGANQFTGRNDFDADVAFGSGRPWLDVTAKVFAGGAKLDGVTNDNAAFQAAVTAANALIHDGGSVGSGVIIYVPYGTGLISAPLLLDSGVTIMGAGVDTTFIKAHSTFSGAELIGMKRIDGTQQSIGILNLTVHGAGLTGSFDGINLDTYFVGTIVSNVKIRSCPGHGLHLQSTAGAGTASGGAVFHNIEADHNGLDQIHINGPFISLAFTGLTDVEHFSAGHHGFHVIGNGWTSHNLIIPNLYSENGVVNAASVLLEQVQGVLLGSVFLGDTVQTGQAAVRITGADNWGATGSHGISVDFVWADRNSGFVVIDDQSRGVQELSAFYPSIISKWSTEVAHVAGIATAPADPSVVTLVSTTPWTNTLGYDVMLYIILNGDATNPKYATLVLFDPNTNQFTIRNDDIAPLATGHAGAGARTTLTALVPHAWGVILTTDATIVQTKAVGV